MTAKRPDLSKLLESLGINEKDLVLYTDPTLMTQKMAVLGMADMIEVSIFKFKEMLEASHGRLPTQSLYALLDKMAAHAILIEEAIFTYEQRAKQLGLNPPDPAPGSSQTTDKIINKAVEEVKNILGGHKSSLFGNTHDDDDDDDGKNNAN